MQIPLTEDIWLTSSKKSYEISQRNKVGHIVPIAFFNSLESCFKFFLNLKIKNSKAVEFEELILLHVEAIKEIKKAIKQLEAKNVI